MAILCSVTVSMGELGIEGRGEKIPDEGDLEGDVSGQLGGEIDITDGEVDETYEKRGIRKE